MINSNHHSCTILPYFVTETDGLMLLVEQKDPNFRAPYFNNGICFLGGNWQKGKHEDSTPRDVAIREIEEEFFVRTDPHESTAELIGQQIADEEGKRYDAAAELSENARSIARIITKDTTPGVDYLIMVPPPVLKQPLLFTGTVYLRGLNLEEADEIGTVLDKYEGKITTDNHKFGSQTRLVSLDEINMENIRFSWGYDKILKLLLNYSLDKQYQGAGLLREMTCVHVSKRDLFAEYEKTKGEGLSFHTIEHSNTAHLRFKSQQ